MVNKGRVTAETRSLDFDVHIDIESFSTHLGILGQLKESLGFLILGPLIFGSLMLHKWGATL